jgi:hypothetical protein
MSTKFEQLLDFIVNEEMDKANELFHEIVVEKSRDIYENLIAEEAEEEEEMDEASEEEDEAVEEAAEDEEEMDESMDLEDSYSMEADDEEEPSMGGDATDNFGSEIGAMGDEEGGEGQEDQAIFDIKNAIQELEAAFAELEKAQGSEEPHDEFGSDDEEGGEEDDMEMMGSQAFEGRRMTREYTEKVGNDWDKSGSQKAQAKYVGSGSGDTEGAPVEGRSPISSGKGKPTTGATAKNIAASAHEGGSPTGTSPAGKAGGFLSAAKDMGTGNGNVPGGKMGVKNLAKVAGGHGAEKKGSGPGPVGSGTGDKAGQTSVGQVKSPINGAPNRNA